ncbi:aldehyde dehydrogenase family protein [Actinoalloteichus caeruleus]|uniref:aldehyde dehydrogenase family protein n=1 Tax=Actinoalloteichus cyanogriseus TaxID=2893586 RepID=UPI003AABC2D0
MTEQLVGVDGVRAATAVSPADGTAPVIEVTDPVTGTPFGRLVMSSPEEVRDAVGLAHRHQPAWAATPPARRGRLLHEMAEEVRASANRLARLNTAETGRPFSQALDGVLAGAATLDQYAELAPVRGGRALLGDVAATDLMVPEPRGVVAVLTPWNEPVAVACGLIGAALATGNTVCFKPSERAPHLGRALGQVLCAPLPSGVLVRVTGDGRVGAALVEDPRVDLIAHVGSTAAGRRVLAAAAVRGAAVLAENGGNDPLLVDSDVDPVWAAGQAAIGAFTNSGQICTAVERVYVHRAVADRFVAALVDQARRYRARPRDTSEVELGPLVDVRHRAHVHGHVTQALDAGAEVGCGGVIPPGPGSSYPATVLTGCRPEMAVFQEETFGPVAPVRVVDSFDQALAEVAVDRYGLAATVLTGSMAHAQRAWRELPVGTVKVNDVFGGAPGGAAQPRRDSGNGFGFGPELLDEMTTVKVVHLGLPGDVANPEP